MTDTPGPEREIVEVMARGANRCGHSLEWSRAIALRIVDELSAAGLAVVPLDPTDAMIEAGYEAVASFDRWCVEDDGDARKLYRAMIALAAAEGESDA